MKLIDKDALVAEIERLKADALQKKSQCKRSGLERIMHQIGAYNIILSSLNSLEDWTEKIKTEINRRMKHHADRAIIDRSASEAGASKEDEDLLSFIESIQEERKN